MSVFYHYADGSVEELYKGCVIDEYEHNMAWDSYWYAIIYTGKGDAFKVETGSTAFANNLPHVEVDASPELMRRYNRYLKIKARLEFREYCIWLSEKAGFSTYHNVAKLAKVYGLKSDALNACIQLLKTKNFRSNFRKSCRDQIVAWLEEDEPKYLTPLSPRQMQYLRTY